MTVREFKDIQIYNALCQIFDEVWHEMSQIRRSFLELYLGDTEYAEEIDRSEKRRKNFDIVYRNFNCLFSDDFLKRRTEYFDDPDVYGSKNIVLKVGTFECTFDVQLLPHLILYFYRIVKPQNKHKIPWERNKETK